MYSASPTPPSSQGMFTCARQLVVGDGGRVRLTGGISQNTILQGDSLCTRYHSQRQPAPMVGVATGANVAAFDNTKIASGNDRSSSLSEER